MEPIEAPDSAIARARKAAEEALSEAPRTDPVLKAARDKAKQDLDGLPNQSPAKLTRTLSYVLDDLIPIPGTKIRVGVDPLLSLAPWAGTAIGGALGSAIVFDAIRLRAPVSVIARMGANALLDWLLGLIPFVGAFFDAAFRANRMNLKLLNRTIENRELVRQASVRYWVSVAGLVALLLSITVAVPILLIMGLVDLLTTP